jgi:hypothetical protein
MVRVGDCCVRPPLIRSARMNLTRLTILAALAALPVTCYGQIWAHTCEDTAFTPLQKQTCAELDVWGAKEGKLYTQIKAKMSSDKRGQAEFIKTEIQWDSFVDSHCNYLDRFADGSDLGLRHYSGNKCHLDWHKIHVSELEYMLHSIEDVEKRPNY